MKTASGTAAARSRPASSGGALVDGRWLAAHLHDPRMRVVEVDVSPAAYTDWHIDGAVLWNVYRDLKDADYRTVSAAEWSGSLPGPASTPAPTVVCYGYAPALGFWLLKLLGHRDVRILDCSRETWRADGLPCSTTESPLADGGYRCGERADIRADRAAVRDAIGRPGMTLLDVRSAAEFQGERSGRRAAWSQVAGPVTCRPPSISRSTACTTTTDRSGRPRGCAMSSHPPSSTPATS